jgi:hypothetical protein
MARTSTQAGSFNWEAIQGFIATQMTPLATQIQQMQETFLAFTQTSVRPSKHKKPAQSASATGTSATAAANDVSDEADFVPDYVDDKPDSDTAPGLESDQESDTPSRSSRSEGEITVEPSKKSTEKPTKERTLVKSLKVLCDRGPVKFQVDLTDQDNPTIGYRERVHLLSLLSGESTSTTSTSVAKAWYRSGKETSSAKLVMDISSQFCDLVVKAVEDVKKSSKKRAFPRPPKASAITQVQDRWRDARVPRREFNKLCSVDHVPQLPSSLVFVKVAPNTLVDLESSVRDVASCLTYLMRTSQSMGSLLDHIFDDGQDGDALIISMGSIMDTQASILDQLNKNTAFLLTALTLVRRDFYLSGLLPYVAKSSVAQNDLRQATIDGCSLFGDREIALIDDIIDYTGELKNLKADRYSDRRPEQRGRSRQRGSSSGHHDRHSSRRRSSSRPAEKRVTLTEPPKVHPPTRQNQPFTKPRWGRGRGRGGARK